MISLNTVYWRNLIWFICFCLTFENMAGGRNFNFKCVLLGEGCVGKTSCVLRYVENKFNEKHLTTLQVCLL